MCYHKLNHQINITCLTFDRFSGGVTSVKGKKGGLKVCLFFNKCVPGSKFKFTLCLVESELTDKEEKQS